MRVDLYHILTLTIFPILLIIEYFHIEYVHAASRKDEMKPINIAFCLTGQLARLELLSKIRNIFIPNAKLGHKVHIFMLLDDEVEQIKQTFWKYDYSDSPFLNFDADRMKGYLHKKFSAAGVSDNVRFWVRMESPVQSHYQIVGNFIPVADKVIHKPNAKMGGEMPEGGIEPAAVRFQNNMRWLGGLRECVKWAQQMEFEQKLFYDLVIRLRDDTLAFGFWKISYEKQGNALTSARTGSFRGVNDHNFIIDRRWADILFRGFTEDYYFNKTLAKEAWGNPEHRIYQLATANRIPIRNETVCEQPLIPLRGKFNSSHWLLHAVYASKFLDECKDPRTKKVDRCTCEPKWTNMFRDGSVGVDLMGI